MSRFVPLCPPVPIRYPEETPVNVVELIQETEARGVRLDVEDGELYAAGPVDEDLLRRLCVHRTAVLSQLRAAALPGPAAGASDGG